MSVIDFNRATLGELAGLAIERELIEHCSISKGSIGLTLGRLNLVLTPEDAGTLLRLILVGTGLRQDLAALGNADVHAVHPGAPVPPARETDQPAPAPETPPQEPYQKREIFRVTSNDAADEPQRNAPREPAPVGGDGNSYAPEAISEEYLDTVLNFALSMHIIEGFSKDKDSNVVTLRTGATTTGLPYWEAIEYLTNSMLFELRARTDQA